jgi:hypothetical protein
VTVCLMAATARPVKMRHSGNVAVAFTGKDIRPAQPGLQRGG